MDRHIEYPKFSAMAKITKEGQPDVHFTFTGEVPQNIMDNFQQIIGDGKSRVSVSVDMGIKEFGTGASGMVTVSLTCNQDEQTVARAVQLAGSAAKWYAANYRNEAEQEVNKILEDRKQRSLSPNGRPNYG